ncbi:hypothetical protein AP058_01084 [Flavobacterium sp. TAB 87]|nr:hypothetical protein AP058_01084 [Flavobacterium sp. TAB 87]
MRILKLYFAVLMLLFFASLLCLQENIFSGIEIKEIKRPVSAIYSTKKEI